MTTKETLDDLLHRHFRSTEEREKAKSVLENIIKKSNPNQPKKSLMLKVALKALNTKKDGISLLHRAVHHQHDQSENNRAPGNNDIHLRLTTEQHQELLTIIKEKVLSHYTNESQAEQAKIEQIAIDILIPASKATGKNVLELAKKGFNICSKTGRNPSYDLIDITRKAQQEIEQLKEETKQKITKEIEVLAKEKNVDSVLIKNTKEGLNEYMERASKAENPLIFLKNKDNWAQALELVRIKTMKQKAEEHIKKEFTKGGELYLSELTKKELGIWFELDNTFYSNEENLKKAFSSAEINKFTPLQRKILSARFIHDWIEKSILTLDEAKVLTAEQFENLRNDIVNTYVTEGRFKANLAKYYYESDNDSIERFIWAGILSIETAVVELIECGKVLPQEVFSLSKDEQIIFDKKFIIELIKNGVITFAQARKLDFVKAFRLQNKAIQQFLQEGKLTIDNINTMTKDDYLNFFIEEAVNEYVIEEFKKMRFNGNIDTIQ